MRWKFAWEIFFNGITSTVRNTPNGILFGISGLFVLSAFTVSALAGNQNFCLKKGKNNLTLCDVVQMQFDVFPNTKTHFTVKTKRAKLVLGTSINNKCACMKWKCTMEPKNPNKSSNSEQNIIQNLISHVKVC